MPKLKAKILIALIHDEFGLDAIAEHRFAAEIVGHGKGLRERLKDAGLKDWRFDVCIPSKKIAIEFEGAVFTNGRHTRGLGYISDIDKYNAATVNGWKVLRFTHTHHVYDDVLRNLRRLV